MRRLVVAAVLLAGCDYATDSFVANGFSGDPYPIVIDRSSGAVVIGMQPDGDTRRDAVLDVLSPFSLVDDGPATAPSIASPSVTLFGERTPGGPLDLPRARIDSPQVITLHPCDTDPCEVGDPSATTPTTRPFTGLLGMSAFASDALRLDLGATPPQLFVLPDVAGDETHRTLACDAVFPAPFWGGGTLLIGGTQDVHFTNWRIAIDTCLAPNTDPNLITPTTAARGADVLLVASTGIGITILDESAYARYQQTVGTAEAPDLSGDPDYAVLLPSGMVHGKKGRNPIKQLALVASSAGNPRAPCRQAYISHVLETNDAPALLSDCPCGKTGGFCSPTFCSAPAVVDLQPTNGAAFIVVPDTEPTLQALRAELRPNRPEVDGILGADVLAASGIELDIDYPHDRLLGRCKDGPTCLARPELIDRTKRCLTQECLGLPRPASCQ